MSSRFEDWLSLLSEKHHWMNAEDQAKLVQEFTSFMMRERIENFDKMSPQQAVQVFAALLEKEALRLTSLRELVIDMLARDAPRDLEH